MLYFRKICDKELCYISSMDKKTTKYYKEHASEFIESTFNADLSSLYSLFLQYIPSSGKILDLGCGSGRDSLYFKNKGYDVYSIDIIEEMISNCKKLGLEKSYCTSIEDYNPSFKFDAIWSLASLVHHSKNECALALNKINSILRKDGILYLSLVKCEGEFSDSNSRFYSGYTSKEVNDMLIKEGFDIIQIDETDDSLKRSRKWINALARKR